MRPTIFAAFLLAAGCTDSLAGSLNGRGPSRSSESDATSADAATGSDGGGATSTFAKGDAFDYTKVAPATQMVTTMLTVFHYATATAPKAVAINADGLGYVSVNATATQADVERMASEACFVIGGAKPCFLIASGNVFAIDASALLDASKGASLARPTALGRTLPMATTAAAAAAIDEYDASSSPKALAIGLDGTITMAPNHFDMTSLVPTSVADAQRAALQRCEMQATFAPCTIFATDAAVTFDPQHPNTAPQIDYARTELNTDMPGAVGAAFNLVSSRYLPSVAAGNNGVVYLTRNGNGGFNTDANATTADAAARSQCQEQEGSEPGGCFKYAVGRDILFAAPILDAVGKVSMETHCKAMPRSDCAAHHTIGCTTTGSYYTNHGGVVALETCTF